MPEAPENVRIRPATPLDATGIVAVHRSDVRQWYRYRQDGSRVPARYGDLEVADKVRHGGPHMSVESSVPHWPCLANGNFPPSSRELGLMNAAR